MCSVTGHPAKLKPTLSVSTTTRCLIFTAYLKLHLISIDPMLLFVSAVALIAACVINIPSVSILFVAAGFSAILLEVFLP